jgi:trimeric autotransporter adhesin
MTGKRFFIALLALLLAAASLAASRPILTSLSPAAVVAGESDVMLVIAGTGFSLSDVVRIDGIPVKAETLDDTHLAVMIPSSELAVPRVITFSVDRASGTGTTAPLMLQVLANAPAIRSLSPSQVAAGSGDVAVRVSGSSFATNAIARINGVARPTTFIDITQIVVTLSRSDVADAGFTRITVGNPNSEASTAVPFLIVPALRPAIALVAPHSIAAGSAPMTLSIAGAWFRDGARVLVDGVPLPTRFIDSRHLSADIGAADVVTPGTMKLTVVNPGDLVSQEVPVAVTAASVPAIESAIPAVPLVVGTASTIGITGENFLSTSVAQVNGSDRPTTFIDDRHLTATLFPTDVVSSSTLQVAVANAGTRGGLSEAATLAVSFPDAPRIRSVAPASVFSGLSSAKLMVSGSNFTERDVVLIGGSPRVTEYVGNTRLVASLQQADLSVAASLDVVVRTEGGTSSAPAAVNVVRPNSPMIAELDPARARLDGDAFALMINGSNFTEDSIVALDGVPQPARWISPTQIIVDVPKSELRTPRSIAVTVLSTRGSPSASVHLPVSVTPPSIGEVTFSSDRPTLESLFLVVSGEGFTAEAAVRINGQLRESRFDPAGGRLIVALQPEDLAALRSVTVTVPGAGQTTSNVDMSLGFRRTPAAGGGSFPLPGNSSTLN